MQIAHSRRIRIFLTDVVLWVAAMGAYVFIRFYDPVDLVASNNIADSRLFEFTQMLLFGLEAGLILGVIYGVVDIVLDQRWLKKKSYGAALMIKGTIHLVVILTLSIWIRAEALQKMDIELTVDSMQEVLIDPGILIALLYTTFVSFSINFTRQITLKFGPGNLTKFITGRFHRPREESRIFMFLDMKDSTTHAEVLGHVKFGELIQDCFSDLTVIENYRAEVYQYVGDEAIVFWDVKKGLDNFNCIRAYFAYSEELRKRSSFYQEKYGLTPGFKAGIHLGEVIVTEIGDIKRDLAFLGDTMNTTARIQDLCNQYQQNLLISESLHLSLSESSQIKRESVDQLTLKGKHESIGIYAVTLA